MLNYNTKLSEDEEEKRKNVYKYLSNRINARNNNIQNNNSFSDALYDSTISSDTDRKKEINRMLIKRVNKINPSNSTFNTQISNDFLVTNKKENEPISEPINEPIKNEIEQKNNVTEPTKQKEETTKKEMTEEQKEEINKIIKEKGMPQQTVTDIQGNYRDKIYKDNSSLNNNIEHNPSSDIKSIETENDGFFKKSDTFDDGYQFGDVSKTALSTGADIVLNFVKGVAQIGENAGNFLCAGIAQVAELTGNKKFAQGMRKAIASNEEKLSSWISDAQENVIDKNSVLGNTGDKIMESGGYLSGLAAVNYFTGGTVGDIVMFSSAAGGKATEVYQKDDIEGWQAWTEMLGAGAVETFSEKLFGFFGTSGLDTAIANKFASKFTSGVAKTLVRFGISALAEGAEEIIAGLGDNMIDKSVDFISALQGKETHFDKGLNWEQMWEEFGMAATTSLLFGGAFHFMNVQQVKSKNNISISEAVNEIAKQQDAEAQREKAYSQLDKINKKMENEVDQNKYNKLQLDKEIIEAGLTITEPFYIAKYDTDGELLSLSSTYGKVIENPNSKLNITPVIVKNDNIYNIIDGNNGTLLDTTPYNTFEEAEKGFNKTIKHISNEQISTINNMMEKNNLTMNLKQRDMLQEAQERNENSIINNQNIQDANAVTNNIENEVQTNANINKVQNLQQNDIVEQNNNPTQQVNSTENKTAQNGFSEQTNKTNMEQRNWNNVSDKNVKSYQTENPEVSQEIQEMAYNFQEDLANSTFGERYKAGDEWTGTKRSTTKELAEIKDDTGASWGKIQKALEDISQGKGDYALAKKVELVLDKALSEGYKNIYGKTIIPNESYLTKKGHIEGKNYLQNETEISTEIESNPEENRIFGERINKKGGNSNARAEKIRNNNSQQKANRTEKGKNTRGEEEISRSNGSSQEKLSKSVQQFQREQQKQLGKDTKISLTEQNKLTKTERTIQKEFENITGLNYGVYESNKGTEDAVYVNDDILVKHNSLQSKKKSNFLPFHELGHWFKVNRSNEWTAIHDIIDNTITKNQIEEYKNVLKDKSIFDNMSEAEIREYIIEEIQSDYFGNWANDISNWADMIRNKMLSDEYVQILIDISDENVSTHYNIFGTQEQQEQVYDKINEMMNNFITENKNSLKTKFESNIKYSFRNDTQEGQYWQIEDSKDLFKGITTTKALQDKAYKFILNGNTNFETITDRIDGKDVKFIRISASEYVYGRNNKKLQGKQYQEKMRTAPSIDDLINNAEVTYHSPLTHENKLFPNGYNNYQGKVGIDNDIFRYIVRVGKTKNNESIFYDISLELLKQKNRSDNKVLGTNNSSSLKSTSTNSIAQKSKTVKSTTATNSNMQKSKNNTIKKSDRIDTNVVATDNQGRQLSKQQQEYFKDTKVRDEDGNLLVMYHGTKDVFTIFKNGKNKYDSGFAGEGFYFTSDYKSAQDYSNWKKGNDNFAPKVMSVYIDAKKPLIIGDFSNGIKTAVGEKLGIEFKTKNPLTITKEDSQKITETLIKKGYDSVIFKAANNPTEQIVMVINSNQIKNVDNTNPTDNPDIRYSNRYDTEENGEGGFYSQLEKVIEEKMPNTSNAQQIKGIIENSGIKQDEIKWIGLDDYLKQHSLEKISKQQLQDYIKANQINIETVQKGTNKLDEYTEPVKQDIASKNIDIQYILDKYGFDYERDDLIPYKLNGLRAGTVGDFMAENLEKYIDLNDFDKYEKQEDGSFIRTYRDSDGIQWTTQFTEKDFKEDMQKLEDLYDQRTEAEMELSSIEDEYGDYADEIGVPKYKQYSLKGGTNYQEILYTLPLNNQNQNEILKLSGEIAELRAKAYLSDPVLATDEERIESNRIYAEINKRQEQLDKLEKLDNVTYKSPHWEEKNVLAHARTQDFEDISGNKVLFIDEIQSDLHQQGRSEGYETKEITKRRAELRNEREKIKENEINYENELRELRNKGYNNAKELYIKKQNKAIKQSSLLEEKYNISNNLTEKQQFELLDYDNSIIAYLSSQVKESVIFRDNIDNNDYMIEQVKKAERNILRLSEDILSKQKNTDVYRQHAIEQFRIGYYDYMNIRHSNMYLGNNDQYLSEAEQSRIYELDKLMKENEDKGISINLELDKLKPKISDVFPFKKNWHEFVLRRMINNAVEQGYDEVAWTTGRQQRERYNLSKAIDYIEYQKLYNHPNDVDTGKVGEVEISAFKDGNNVFDRQIKPEELADYIGKDLSTRILTSKEGKGTISNLDEEIRENGNSGMYVFYDQEIPNYLNKYLKKWNSKVEEITLKDADGKAESKQMGFKITDEMRNSIKQNGQPLFSNRQLDEEESSTYDERIQRKNRELIKELREQKESIQGLEGYSRSEIKDIVSNYIQDKLMENDLEDISINGAEIIGSRNRGNAKTTSDLDLVVEYSGDIREDDLFNILNEEPLEIEGIKVDINPITADNTGTLEEYLERSRQYDREVLNATKKETIRKEDPNVAPGATNAQGADRFIEQEIRKIEATGNWDNSIPVTKLTDIRETIEDFLGLGVKKGHFRERAYGIYKQGRDVIRGKELKDIDNILHETGHALDLGNRLKIDKESIANELLTAIQKHGGYENETRSTKLDEGFAEIIRSYGIIPGQTKIDYPQTVAVLEQIRRADKSFDNFISKVQQQTYNYIHQNPQNRVHSNISVGENNKAPLTKSWIEQEVMRNVWDKDYAVKKAVNEFAKKSNKTVNQIKASDNAYYLTRLATGIHDKVTSMLSDGYIDENGNQIMPGLNKIGEILGDDPQRYNDLRDYLVAKRDTDYKKKTLKTGIRDMDTKYVLEKFKNDTQIQEAAKTVYRTLDGVMQYAVNNGLISEDDVKSLKESNAFYVPMQRVIEGKGNQLGRKGAVSDIIKARTGSELDIKDVLENIVSNSTNIIQQVENNNVLRALYNQGEEAGLTGSIYDVIPAPMMKVGTANLSMWENELKKQGVNTTELDLEKTVDIFAPNNKIDTKNLITSFIDTNGKRVYLQFNDEILFNSLMNLDGKMMSNVLKINSKLNMPLRYGATMANIGFAIPNMISDTAQAAIFSNAGFIPVVDNALGVLDILTATNKHVKSFVKNYSPEYVNRIENMYNLYRQSGATSSTRMSQFRDSTQSNMKDIYGTKNSKVLGINEKWKPLKRLLDIMTYIPEISEQSTRFRVFERNYDMYKSKGNSEMDSRILAALESRDATQDFGRTGNLTREINQLIPFSAARVGSIYTFAEKVNSNPKQVAIRIALLTAIGMAIKAIGYDDKDIEELNQRKKDDNFVLKVGDNVVTIKKPQGILRSMLNLSEYIQDLATGHIEDGKEGERVGAWIKNTVTDNLPADNMLAAVGSSSVIGGIAEYIANKDFYYNTDIVKSYDLDLPDYMQYYEYNSQLAILLGKVFNQSPAKIDNLISSWFGGLGTQVTGIIDYLSGKVGLSAQKPEMGAESDAIGKRFIVNVNSNSASVDEIYNRKTELTKKKNGGTITSEEETELSNITAAVSNMSKVNKQIKEIKRDLTMSGREKAEQIKELQRQRTDIARQALDKDMIHQENAGKIETTSFYPTNSSLSLNHYTLELTSDMKEEYATLASEFYKKYESQGLYSQEKLKQIKTKAKEYAKKQLMQKYKSQLVKSK